MATKKKRPGRDVGLAAARVLKALRAEGGDKQEELATRLGKSRGWVSLLETGQYKVTAQDIVDFSAVYEKDPLEVFRRILEFKG